MHADRVEPTCQACMKLECDLVATLEPVAESTPFWHFVDGKDVWWRKLLAPLASAVVVFTLSCVTPSRGVLVRVAEGLCEAAVELIDDKGISQTICPLAVDLVTILGELRSAEEQKRDAVIRLADGKGQERTVVVPANQVNAALGSTNKALGRSLAPQPNPSASSTPAK
jgi:hypothetical protein